MFRITTALSGLSLLALASCAAEPDSKRYTSYTPRAELARRVAPPPPAPEVTMSRLSSRHRVALSYEANAARKTTDEVVGELVKVVAVA